MNIRQFGMMGSLGLTACASSTIEAIRARGEIGIAPVHVTESRAPPIERCIQDGERLFAGAVARMISPVYDLATFRFTQPRVELRLVDGSGIHRLLFGPIVGQFRISHPNDATLEQMSSLTERVAAISWHATNLGWMSNTLSVVIGRGGVAIYPVGLPPESMPRILLGEHGRPNGFLDEELLVVGHGHRKIGDEEFESRELLLAPWVPSFEGIIEFFPQWVGLMRDGALVGCVPVK